MVLTEKETAALKDLQSQEKTCAQKYQKYSEQAKDPELKNLFQTIQKEEQKHYDSLGQVLRTVCFSWENLQYSLRYLRLELLRRYFI